MRSIAFFNNKGGVGKTSLVYHLAWMYSDLDKRVLAVDLDPQSNLTSMFLPEERLEQLWPDGPHPETILGVVEPIVRGLGDIAAAKVHEINENLGLMAGDLGLSNFEGKLSDQWPRCFSRDEAAFRTTTAFHRSIRLAASSMDAELILVDMGPNLGAINRAALIASENVVIPLAPDLFSLQGLKNLGPSLEKWREEWARMIPLSPDPLLSLPAATMRPIGYVVMQYAVRRDRPVKAYEAWSKRIEVEYEKLIGSQHKWQLFGPESHCLATLRHYRSLMPMAMEARKPMFHLKPADGAIGAHAAAVSDCWADFERLAKGIVSALPFEDA